MRHVSFRALAVFMLLLAHMAVAGTPNRVTILYDSFGRSPTLETEDTLLRLVQDYSMNGEEQGAHGISSTSKACLP
jgi:hypothetical protein